MMGGLSEGWGDFTRVEGMGWSRPGWVLGTRHQSLNGFGWTLCGEGVADTKGNLLYTGG